jgi:hypothetical protein
LVFAGADYNDYMPKAFMRVIDKVNMPFLDQHMAL